MGNMDGMEWRRHMLGAKEIVRQKALSGLPKGRDAGFLSAFMATWEALTSVTTGETPFLDFLTVLPHKSISNNSTIISSFPEGKGYYSPTLRNQTTKERNIP
jgi:hypothetical protein